MRHLETLLLALSAGGFLVRANLVQELSFAAPFSSFESDGSRRVSPHFRVYGHAVVNENFVRLTPDRQSKRGALWSRMEIATQSFSTTLRFRISGSGKKFFGDGIALWITHNTRYNPGDLHGVNPKFVGVGIVFDTFRNTEALDKHRDVALLVNDGTKTVDDMYEVVQGCDAAVRVWEQRADFDVSKAARAKVEIVGREVRVQVDEKEDGNWEECIRTTLPDTIPEAWLKSAHVGVTASTGQLADNHDVLSLQSFSELEKARLHERMEDEKTFFETDPAAPVDERLSLVEETLNQILSRLDVNEHALEHKIVGVEDHIKSIVMKIETREDQAEDRIGSLEDKITMAAQTDTIRRLERLEKDLKRSVEQQLEMQKQTINTRFTELGNLGGGWQIPFVLMFLLFCAGAFMMYRYHLYLRKTHLL